MHVLARERPNPPLRSNPTTLTDPSIPYRCCRSLNLYLANKAQAAQSNIKHKEWIDCNANAVLDYATATHDADPSSK